MRVEKGKEKRKRIAVIAMTFVIIQQYYYYY
jgi:hypothetical protein